MPLRSAALVTLLVLSACAAPVATTTTNKAEKDQTSTKDPKAADPSAKGTTNPTPDPGEQDAELTDFLLPEAIHTGFTGGNEVFKVPVWTDLKAPLTWKLTDASIATIAEHAPPSDYTEQAGAPKLTFAMLTATKAGTTEVTVTGGGKTAKATVTVKAYTSAAYAAGQTRYKTGGTEANRKACASCHEAAGGADHSPTWLAYYDDEDILGAIQTAVYASDTYEVNKGNHKWNLTDPEKEGILAFLRGLPPKAFP